jgi:glycosyltransferase involved in cell wall biosynthesis
MKMKKVLFVAPSLKAGGIERALVNQINSLDFDKYDVYLYLFSETGSYINQINRNVHIVCSNFVMSCIGKSRVEARKHFTMALMRAILALIARLIGSLRLFNILYKMMPNIGPFDWAISYVHNGNDRSLYYGANKFVIEKVKACKKIAWIHSDYVGLNMRTQASDDEYRKMDCVVNVTNFMKRRFDELKLVPLDKSFTVYNRINSDEMICESLSPFKKEQNRFIIITTGRVESRKGTYKLCVIAKRLVEKGDDFRWYFIGDGVDMKKCSEFVQANNLERYVCFLGSLDNPYPYVKNSNLYVSASETETFGYSIVEALTFNVPVVALKYDAIGEILENGNNGVICETLDSMCDEIHKNITNPQNYYDLKQKAKLLMDYNLMNDVQFEEVLK